MLPVVHLCGRGREQHPYRTSTSHWSYSMPQRIPTDAEIKVAARELNLLVDGEVPRSQRGRIAKAIVLAETEQADDVENSSIGEFTDQMVDIYEALASRMPTECSAAILRAVAPRILAQLQMKESAQ